MDRRRVVAAAFFSAVVVVVLGVLVWVQASANQHTVSVFVLRHAVTAGSVYSADDVSAVTIHASAGDFNFEQRAPDAYSARYTQDLAANDIVRADDLVDSDADVEVAITVASAPAVAPGDRIDVFATVAGGRQAQIGRAVPVLGAAGDALTILVPTRDEEAWVSIASSTVTLHAALAGGSSTSDPSPLSPSDAVTQLCGSACSSTTP